MHLVGLVAQTEKGLHARLIGGSNIVNASNCAAQAHKNTNLYITRGFVFVCQFLFAIHLIKYLSWEPVLCSCVKA